MKPRPHPPAHPHGELREVFPGIHFVTGTMAMGPGVKISRNMTVVSEGDRLVIVNSVRLDDAGLERLDALGNTTDPYFSLFGRVVMRLMGFIKSHNVGPAWLKNTKPPAKDLRGVLDLEFEHVLPAHGAPVVGGAKPAYRASLERAVAFRSA